MATIIDPLGTPSIVYNRSGSVLIAMNAAGTSAGTGAAIPNVCGHTIVFVTYVGVSDDSVVLPSGADVGDIVEVFGVTGANLSVWAPTGETIGSGGGAVSIDGNKGCRCVKLDSTVWRSIS